MTSSINFSFDLPSPCAYLARTQLPRIAGEHGATIVFHLLRILEIMKSVDNGPTTARRRSNARTKASMPAERLLERASAVTVIAQLQAGTSAAAAREGFGAPTIFVGDQMFFVNDRLDFVGEALRSKI